MLEFVMKWYRCGKECLCHAIGLPLLGLRIFLFPIFLQAGWTKFAGFQGSVRFFQNQGIPFPELAVFVVGTVEFVGAILLLLGLMTRAITVPLMVTMLVAAFLVHAENGWLVLSDSDSWLANERVMEAREKKEIIRDLVNEHEDAKWLKSSGPVTILNNGMEFAITYLLMLFVLFFYGGGRYVGIDYWIDKWRRPRTTEVPTTE